MIYKVGLNGASGRMGLLIAGLLEDGFSRNGDTLELADAVAGTKRLTRLGSIEVRTLDESPREPVHVWIDFSRPAATLTLLEKIATPVLIGTTGFSCDELGTIRDYSAQHSVLLAPNTSPGMNRMLRALRLLGLSPEWGFEAVLEEDHHRHKKDAPSGTAKALLKVLEELGYGKVQVQVTRAGGIVGNHRVRFISDEEELCLEHRVFDRNVFAKGALLGALALARRKKPGLITMDEVLEERA